MKKSILKLLMLFVATGFVYTSCDDDDTVTSSTEAITADEVSAVVEADEATDEVNGILDDYFASEDIAARTDIKYTSPLDCMTKTIVLTAENQTVTLDYGDGCELPNGNVISGKIILTYTLNLDVSSFTVTTTYENFYFNDLSITGTTTMTRVRENANGNPESTLVTDLKVTWPDGDWSAREGTKVREFIEGYDTVIFEDNVFLTTGNWKSTFRDGTVVESTITEALRREATCIYFVSGKVELVKGDSYGTLDYGNGDCDNIAIFTTDTGEEIEIILEGRIDI